MALNIPMPELPGNALLQGFHTGGNLFQQFMHPRLEREKQAQLERHFQEQLKLSKAAAGRAAQAAMDAHSKALRESDPLWELKQLPARLKMLQSMNLGGQSGAPGNQSSGQQQYPDLHKMFAGQGVFPEGVMRQGNLDLNNRPEVPNPETGGISTVNSMSIGTPQGEVLIPRVSDDGRIMSEPEAIANFHKTGKHMGIYSSPDEATRAAKQIHEDQDKNIAPQTSQQQNSANNPYGIDFDAIKDQLKQQAIYKAMGLKAPANGVYKEPPDIKRQKDFEYKMKEARYKHQIEQEDEKTKNELKNQQTRQKVVDSAKNDLPHLEETLRSLEVMKKIAADPKNDDMFGHWWLGHEKAASRITNPKAGDWQTYGLDPIIDAEMRMSGKGNQLALKTSLANKANFGEQRAVALRKVETSIDKMKRRIEQTRKIANESNSNNPYSKMSIEELTAMAGG